MKLSIQVATFFFFIVLGNSPSFAQTVVDKQVINWNPDQFSEVLFPSEFGVVENLIWGAKVLFNHPDFKEIVPVYAYNRTDFCDRKNKENTLPGALILDVSSKTNSNESVSAEKSSVGKAKWEESLATVCEKLDLKFDLGDWTIQDDNSGISALFKKLVFYSEMPSTGNSPSSDEYFILTIDELPDIDPVVEFWWMCNDETEQIPDTVCHEVFQYSPFFQHKQLVER